MMYLNVGDVDFFFFKKRIEICRNGEILKGGGGRKVVF